MGRLNSVKDDGEVEKIGKGRLAYKKIFLAILGFIVVYCLVHFLSLKDNSIVNTFVKDALLIVLVLFLLMIGLRIYSLVSGFRKVRKFIGPQTSDRVTQIIEQCKPLHRSFEPKKKHVVIMLHGFISSPVIFDELVKDFEENEIDYQAPLINGFGIKRIQLLFSLTEDEWIRQVTEMYDVLASQYESISVIGHSLGGALALYLSQVRPVNHLILIAPAIFPCRSQKLHNFLATNNVLFRIVPWIIPLLPVKSSGTELIDEESVKRYKLYPVAPTKGVFNILRLQERVNVKKADYQTLDLFYGTQDIAVDGQKVWDYLKRDNVLHRVHRLDHTGHNPLIDSEKDLVGWIVLFILNNELEWPPAHQVSQ